MEWTRQHDVVFCREILATDPFQGKRKTTHRAKLWEKVAENLEKNDHIKFKVSVRSVRDRYSRISQKSRKKARDELKSTGTSPEMTEYDTLMEELIEREDMSEEKRQNAVEDSSKVELDRTKALDMRTKAMEKLSQTQKRQSDCEVGPKKKTRKTSSETIVYLKEKHEQELEIRKQELELKKQQFETDRKRQEEMMSMMMQQSQLLVSLIKDKNTS